MKMPFKPSMLQLRRQSVKWIILHHTAEMYDMPSARIDNEKYQMKDLVSGVLEKKQGDINYNFVVEKIKEDYNVFVARPFPYKCVWGDISNDINNRAIHVACLGSYDFKIPPKRLYEVLAYRILNPFMHMFHLSPSRIKFHRDVSDDKELTCPGDFFDYGIVESMVRKFVLK